MEDNNKNNENQMKGDGEFSLHPIVNYKMTFNNLINNAISQSNTQEGKGLLNGILTYFRSMVKKIDNIIIPDDFVTVDINNDFTIMLEQALLFGNRVFVKKDKKNINGKDTEGYTTYSINQEQGIAYRSYLQSNHPFAFLYKQLFE